LVACLSIVGGSSSLHYWLVQPPPWPDPNNAYWAASAAAIVIIVISFLLLYFERVKVAVLKRCVWYSVIAIGVFWFVYFLLWTFGTMEVPDAKHLQVVGWMYTEKAKQDFRADSELTPERLVSQNGNEVKKVYVPWTSMANNVCFFIAWVGR